MVNLRINGRVINAKRNKNKKESLSLATVDLERKQTRACRAEDHGPRCRQRGPWSSARHARVCFLSRSTVARESDSFLFLFRFAFITRPFIRKFTILP